MIASANSVNFPFINHIHSVYFNSLFFLFLQWLHAPPVRPPRQFESHCCKQTVTVCLIGVLCSENFSWEENTMVNILMCLTVPPVTARHHFFLFINGVAQRSFYRSTFGTGHGIHYERQKKKKKFKK